MTSSDTHHILADAREVAILNWAFAHLSELDRLAELSPGDFRSSAHASIWVTMQRLHAAGTPPDLLAVADHIDRHADIRRELCPDWLPWLQSLVNDAPVAMIDEYVHEVIAEAERRRLQAEFRAAADRLADPAIATADVIDRLQSVIDCDRSPFSQAENRLRSQVAKCDTQNFTPFPVTSLPRPLGGFSVMAAKAIGVDPAAVAVPLLVACAAAIGQSRIVRLKADWHEPAVLWAALIAKSGERKSPALAMVLQSLRERQRLALKKYQREYDQWLAGAMAEFESDRKAWAKDKNPSKGPPPEKPEEPVAWRLLVDDVTIEALAGLLQKQPRGLLLACDELSGWLGSFQRYKSGGSSDAPKWLEIHGAKTLMVDRKTGDPKTLYVPRAAVSVIGSIQPDILRHALTPEHRASGMAARLLLAMPPASPRRWSENEVSEQSQQVIGELFDRLLALEMTAPETEDDDSKPVTISLGDDAKRLFAEFVNEHGREQHQMTGDLVATWSKLEGYAARLALVIHMVRFVSGDLPASGENRIDAISMQSAIELVEWFKLESKRIDSTFGMTSQAREQRTLTEWIDRHGGSVTAKDLQRLGPAKYRIPDAAEKALDRLRKDGFGVWKSVPTAGRPRREFQLTDSATLRPKSLSELGNYRSVANEPEIEPLELGPRPFSEAELKVFNDWATTSVNPL